jgi:hypothetical protein
MIEDGREFVTGEYVNLENLEETKKVNGFSKRAGLYSELSCDSILRLGLKKRFAYLTQAILNGKIRK